MEFISYRERDSLKDLLCLTLGELHENFSSTDIVDMGAKLWKAIVNIKRSEFTLIHDIFTKYPSRNLIRDQDSTGQFITTGFSSPNKYGIHELG